MSACSWRTRWSLPLAQWHSRSQGIILLRSLSKVHAATSKGKCGNVRFTFCDGVKGETELYNSWSYLHASTVTSLPTPRKCRKLGEWRLHILFAIRLNNELHLNIVNRHYIGVSQPPTLTLPLPQSQYNTQYNWIEWIIIYLFYLNSGTSNICSNICSNTCKSCKSLLCVLTVKCQ